MSGKKGIIALMVAVAALSLLLVMMFAAPVYADVIEAEELTDQLEISSEDDPDGLKNLTDGKIATRYVCAADTTVDFTCDEPVSQIYVIIDKPVDGYIVKYNGKEQQCGENGFLHEYIELEEPAEEFSIVFTAEKTSVCEIYCFGEGETPDWVQKWLPPYEDADMLVLPTHADDEHLWFGGTMPYYAGELGYKVQVAYMTNHWEDRRRPHELLNGLWLVGIKAYPVISEFPDAYVETIEQAENFYGHDTILEWQVEQLRRFKPEVVIAHDLDGEYGHGAHMLNAVTILEAAPLAADAEQFAESAEKYGVWELPKLYLHLYPENELVMDWSIPLENFDGKTALDMAKEGYLEHDSQQYAWFEVRDNGKYDCRKFGLAYTTVGLDNAEEPDFMQNITHFSDEADIIEVPEESESESVPESSQEQSNDQSFSEAESSAAETTAAQSGEYFEQQSTVKKSSSNLLLIVAIGAATAIVIAALLLQIYREKPKREKIDEDKK